MYRLILITAALLTPSVLASQGKEEWANFGRYAAENAALEKAPVVVFMGDSITDHWDDADPTYFSTHNYACRGISGQVTGQMLCRFRADVIALKPKAAVILGGTNDIACNEGYAPVERIADHIISMAELARTNGIEPVICSILPVKVYPWRPEIGDVPAKIRAVNARLRAYAEDNGLAWVDCYASLVAADGGMRADYTSDGVHLTGTGYAAMERIITPVLAKYAAE